jgi:hypothetical protein
VYSLDPLRRVVLFLIRLLLVTASGTGGRAMLASLIAFSIARTARAMISKSSKSRRVQITLAVRCKECGAQGPRSVSSDPAHAIFAWNQRVGRLSAVR